MPRSRLVNRNVVAGTGRTSMRLEPELWDALAEICEREGRGIHELVRGIDGQRERGGAPARCGCSWCSISGRRRPRQGTWRRGTGRRARRRRKRLV